MAKTHTDLLRRAFVTLNNLRALDPTVIPPGLIVHAVQNG